MEELRLELRDTAWPFDYIDHDRLIVRAIVADGSGEFLFVRQDRDDIFGRAQLIETSGGGVEPGEELVPALKRELREELGAEVEVLEKLGFVSDYYNLVHRHNLNHYYLCRVTGCCAPSLTEDERKLFRLSPLKLSYEAAKAEYARCAGSRLGSLIAARELPVLCRAGELLGHER